MKIVVAFIIAMMGLAAAPELAAQDRNPQRNPLDQGNDVCPATVIQMAPYYDEGSTVGMANDFAGTCGGSAAVDVIYEFAPAQTDSYSVSLCGTNWDTVMYIREGGSCPGDSQIVCNDDYCGLASTVFTRLYAGHTYYIIVDGYYSGAAGPYQMFVLPHPECNLGSYHSIPAEVSEYPIDSVFYQHDPNGACMDDSLMFQPYASNYLIGRTFNYYDDGGELRADEDWFTFTINQPETLTATIIAEIPVSFELLRIWGECDSVSLIAQTTQAECSLMTIVRTCLPTGTYGLRVTCAADTEITIPQFYKLMLTRYWHACPCDSVEGLTAFVSPDHEHVWLHWDADSSGEEFWIYSTEEMSAPFDPDSLWERQAVHTAALPGRQCWTDEESEAPYKRYVVLRNCL